MVLVKATRESEAGEMPDEMLLTEMTKYNEELVKAGVMLSGEGLHPSSRGARVRFSGTNRSVVNGPFDAMNELVAGFWLWRVASMQEAIEWVKRCPNPMRSESEIEIRQVFDAADFGDALTPELREREERMRMDMVARQVVPARLEDGQSMTFAGLNGAYTMETRRGIPEQWGRLCSHLGSIAGQIGHDSFGVSWNIRKEQSFDYLCGVQVSPGTPLPAGFTTVTLAPRRYAVFVHHGHVSEIAAFIDSIYDAWLPTSGFQTGGAPCFERYTQEFNPETGKGGTEIWIPIQAT